MPFRFESQAGKRKVERNAGIGFATETKRMWLRGRADGWQSDLGEVNFTLS
jgi:hypothetical protein